jgi:hypothetical protein
VEILDEMIDVVTVFHHFPVLAAEQHDPSLAVQDKQGV